MRVLFAFFLSLDAAKKAVVVSYFSPLISPVEFPKPFRLFLVLEYTRNRRYHDGMNTETPKPKKLSIATIDKRLKLSQDKTIALEKKRDIALAAKALASAPRIDKIRSRQWILRGRYYWEEKLSPAERLSFDQAVLDWAFQRDKPVMEEAIKNDVVAIAKAQEKQKAVSAAAEKKATAQAKKQTVPDITGTER